MKVDILGTEYEINIVDKNDDKFLKEIDGYCDKSSHKIVICKESEDNELDNFKSYQDKVLRHEIIHAFLFESGLHENFKHERWGHEETMIDWFACQYSKIKKVYDELGI